MKKDKKEIESSKFTVYFWNKKFFVKNGVRKLHGQVVDTKTKTAKMFHSKEELLDFMFSQLEIHDSK